MVEWPTETLLLDDSLIILKYNVFIDRAPGTKLHKREQKDRTKTLAEFPGHVLKDHDHIKSIVLTRQSLERLHTYTISFQSDSHNTQYIFF
jgi:hypothetical protein